MKAEELSADELPQLKALEGPGGTPHKQDASLRPRLLGKSPGAAPAIRRLGLSQQHLAWCSSPFLRQGISIVATCLYTKAGSQAASKYSLWLNSC